MDKIVLLISSVFGIGYIKYASGTFASAAGVIIWFFIPSNYETQAIIIISTIIISIITASIAERIYDNIDDGRIVIDEICGMWLTLFLLPKTPLFLIAGFFLFRLLDITKPLFINKLQGLKSGLGITADDVAAGIVGNLILQGLNIAIIYNSTGAI
ncbi:MAG: phosphatidylglycerophosphatase A [Elusimicrobiota bacterium]|jgi:phosphatidylglycerophosphatase A|nr:phosphatidylglycerophosphatase A [Elusimicrobiota bacterium]